MKIMMVLFLLIFEALQYKNENPFKKSMFTKQVERKHYFIGPQTI